MENIELRYQLVDDERPSDTEIVPECEVDQLVLEIQAHGGTIIGKRVVGWREMLARMENSHEL